MLLDGLCLGVNLIEQMVISLGSWMVEIVASAITNLIEVNLMNNNKSMFAGVGAVVWGP